MEKGKHYGEKKRKHIDTKKNFVSDLRKGSPTNLPLYYRCYRKDNEDILRIKK